MSRCTVFLVLGLLLGSCGSQSPRIATVPAQEIVGPLPATAIVKNQPSEPAKAITATRHESAVVAPPKVTELEPPAARKKPALRWLPKGRLQIGDNWILNRSKECIRMPFEGRMIDRCGVGRISLCDSSEECTPPPEHVVTDGRGQRAWHDSYYKEDLVCVRVHKSTRCYALLDAGFTEQQKRDPVFVALQHADHFYLKYSGIEAEPSKAEDRCFKWRVEHDRAQGAVTLTRKHRSSRHGTTKLRLFLWSPYHWQWSRTYRSRKHEKVRSVVLCRTLIGKLREVTDEHLGFSQSTFYRTREACEGTSRNLIARCGETVNAPPKPNNSEAP